MTAKLLNISQSPHIKADDTTPKIMYTVALALVPALLVSFMYFGLGAIKVTLVAIVSCILFEYLIQKFILKGPITINDGSALVSGLLLAFNVPSNLPCWIIIVGSLVTIGIAKMTFGGLGKNPFNPALVGRVFLLISFPVQMTSWPKPVLWNFTSLDVVTGATALGTIKEGLRQGQLFENLLQQVPTYYDMFLGNLGGSLGEVSALALIIGGVFMLIRKVITWHIPVMFILTTFVFTGIFWLCDSQHYADPVFHLFTGGLILGAVFMATDMVTSPMSKLGMIVFGVGCGLLTAIIRLFGAYPEGVSFAILIMNACVPLINIILKPKRFGAN